MFGAYAHPNRRLQPSKPDNGTSEIGPTQTLPLASKNVCPRKERADRLTLAAFRRSRVHVVAFDLCQLFPRDLLVRRDRVIRVDVISTTLRNGTD